MNQQTGTYRVEFIRPKGCLSPTTQVTRNPLILAHDLEVDGYQVSQIITTPVPPLEDNPIFFKVFAQHTALDDEDRTTIEYREVISSYSRLLDVIAYIEGEGSWGITHILPVDSDGCHDGPCRYIQNTNDPDFELYYNPGSCACLHCAGTEVLESLSEEQMAAYITMGYELEVNLDREAKELVTSQASSPTTS